MLTVRDGALLAAGMWFAGASTFFYRRKQTLPFKVSDQSQTPASVLSFDLSAFGGISINKYCVAGGILSVMAHSRQCNHIGHDAQ